MSVSLADRVVINRESLTKYLMIYTGRWDQQYWDETIESLYKHLTQRMPSEKAIEALKERMACGIVMPYMDRTIDVSETPHRFLFGCVKFDGYTKHDWLDELRKIMEKDAMIAEVRKEAYNLGVIMPFEYVPNARQAYNWLMENVSKDQVDTVKNKMKNLVYAYGGAVICNIFERPEWKTKIEKLYNWNTGYFFERLIYEAYKPNEILAIKSHELSRLNKSLVKAINNTTGK